MEFKLVVGNVSSYLSSDPGVITYLEGPMQTQQPPHWAVRSAAAIALLFKVGAIVLGLISVVLLSYLGIMMSWGLAFGLPWTLAYFYFIWICPAHQLTMGIRLCVPFFACSCSCSSCCRKLKPYRMLWWVASTGLHILVLALVLASTTSISYLHIGHANLANLAKPVVFLSLILAILVIFEVLVLYAVFLIFMEKSRVEAQSERTVYSDSILSSPARTTTPPPAYSDLVPTPEKNPPKYEDLNFK